MTQGINYNWRVGREVSVLPGELTFKRCLEMSKASLRVAVEVLREGLVRANMAGWWRGWL